MEKAKKCLENVSIVAAKCKSTITIGYKKWALDLLLKQTHKEEDNSNCGKSCLQSNRHLYLKLSNFLNGGFRVLFRSVWASLDDLLFTSLDTKYYRRLERENGELKARVSLLTVHMHARFQADEEVGDKRAAILAKCGQIRESLTSDAELTVDQMKKLERELKEICEQIFSSSHGQPVACVASTSAAGAGGSQFAAGRGINAADQLHSMGKQLCTAGINPEQSTSGSTMAASSSAPHGQWESGQKQPQQQQQKKGKKDKGGGRGDGKQSSESGQQQQPQAAHCGSGQAAREELQQQPQKNVATTGSVTIVVEDERVEYSHRRPALPVKKEEEKEADAEEEAEEKEEADAEEEADAAITAV